MLLLDRNNEPTSTVYYLAAMAYDHLGDHAGLDVSELYEWAVGQLEGKKINYEFFLMALDFLFLLERITVDEKGGLYVHKVIKDSQY